MSPQEAQPPYVPPPADYTEPPPSRPTSVTFVAVTGIIIGILGLLCISGAIVINYANINGQRDQMAQMEQHREMMVFGIACGVLGYGLSLMLLIASIGAMSLRPWARKALVAYAVIDLIYDTVKLYLTLVWMMPVMLHVMERAPKQGNVDPKDMVNFMRWGLLVQTWAIWVVLVAFAIIVLAVMMSARVKHAFEPPQLRDTGGDFPVSAPAPPAPVPPAAA